MKDEVRSVIFTFSLHPAYHTYSRFQLSAIHAFVGAQQCCAPTCGVCNARSPIRQKLLAHRIAVFSSRDKLSVPSALKGANHRCIINISITADAYSTVGLQSEGSLL
ncbi:hypothetical protein SAMD00079811_73520 [Scytonema sp. HK-05]|nr:hypothetical protein SAMD00079811_73520 [Scytonema sp. HK-05]